MYNLAKNSASDWSDYANIKSIALEEYWKDTEPDIFSFNINGITGTFYMGEDGKFYCGSNPDIKIEKEELVTISFPDYCGVKLTRPDSTWGSFKYSQQSNKTIPGFKITMNDGFQYIFGYYGDLFNDPIVPNVMEYSVDFFDQLFLKKNYNTWMLRKIISPTNNEVTFNYQLGKAPNFYNTYFVAGFYKVTTYQLINGTQKPSVIDKIFFPFSGGLTASQQNMSSRFSGEIIMAVYLSSIESNTKKLDFSISMTNELKYNYDEILADLQSQIFYNYAPLVWSNTPRSVVGYNTSCIYSTETIITGNGFNYNLDRSDFYGYDLSWLVDMNLHRADIYSSYENFICTPDNPYYSISSYGLGAPPIVEGIDVNRFQWFKLDSVRLFNKSNNQCIRKWELGYNNKSNERLMLLSLREKGENNATKNPYTFEYEDYYGTNKYAGNYKLPGYLQPYLDHWGYYNAINSNLTTFTDATMSNYSNLRETVPEYLYTGMLNKINYPLGGNVEFTYEPNEYKTWIKRNQSTGNFEPQNLSTSKKGGGLRIKNIKYKEGNAVLLEKGYVYSDGILGQEIKYYWSDYKGVLESNTNTTYTAVRFISENLLPGCGGLDYSVAYPKVEEKISGIGTSEHYYSNHLTNPDENFITTIDTYKSITSPFSSKKFERGKLLRKVIKDESGKIKKIENYKYEKNNKVPKEFVPAIATWRFELWEGWSIEGAAYKNYVYPYNLIEKIDSIYDLNGNYLTKTMVKYEYNAHNLLQKEKTANINDTIARVYKYIVDYPIDNTNTAFGQMADFNIFTPIVEQYEYKNNTLLSGIFNNYENMGNRIYAPCNISQQIGNNPKEQRIIINRYDRRGHPTYMIKDDNEKIVNLWSYDYQYPIAEIKGATLLEVMGALNCKGNADLDLLEKQLIPNVTNIDGLLRNYFNGKNVQVTTYTYTPLVGMKTMTDPRGITIYYEYDNFGRLKETYYYENNDPNKKRKVESYDYHYKNN